MARTNTRQRNGTSTASSTLAAPRRGDRPWRARRERIRGLLSGREAGNSIGGTVLPKIEIPELSEKPFWNPTPGGVGLTRVFGPPWESAGRQSSRRRGGTRRDQGERRALARQFFIIVLSGWLTPSLLE